MSCRTLVASLMGELAVCRLSENHSVFLTLASVITLKSTRVICGEMDLLHGTLDFFIVAVVLNSVIPASCKGTPHPTSC